VVLLGQDGVDVAVSGCGESQGLFGTIDNHIKISRINNIDLLTQIDIFINSEGHRWQYPCTYPTWQLVKKQNGDDQLDLYFEPVHASAVPVTFTVVLTFSEGTIIQRDINGSSGQCCTQ
jgi:hypothetical protein